MGVSTQSTWDLDLRRYELVNRLKRVNIINF